MTEQSKQTSRVLTVVICVIVLAPLVIWGGCKRKPSGQANTERPGSPGQPGLTDAGSDKTRYVETEQPTGLKPGLNEVIRAAKTWDASFTSWFGKPAPDFTLTDTTGKAHKLSEYAGKDVILLFWATWCPTCRAEIPHLIELQNTNAEDKPVILAVSRESVSSLEGFIAREKINFAVISNTATMPMPYSLVQYIPSTFFIDRQGKIKLAVTGMVPVDEIRAILRAR